MQEWPSHLVDAAGSATYVTSEAVLHGPFGCISWMKGVGRLRVVSVFRLFSFISDPIGGGGGGLPKV